jgi:N-acyl-phosphatidylethanolamine-hydrolysing phospholipase D
MVHDNNRLNSLKKNGRFINFNASKRVRRTLLDFLLWKIGFYNIYNEKLNVPDDFIFPKISKPFIYNKPWIMWIGHCTFLIKNKNVKILTDPIWNDNCSPFSFIGPKRRHPPPLDIAQLNQINYVLISHNHYDHLDKKTILDLNKKFKKQIKWIVPLGTKKWFKKKTIDNVIELNWWQNYEDELINIYSVPAQHYSGRNILDGNKSLWTGYVLKVKEDQKKLYFTGDSGYNDIDFKKIGNKFNEIDLSLIPIGTYIPRKFMKPVHTDPQDAIKIHKDVNSKFSIGMHWRTFHLSDENMHLPPYELYLNLKKENIDTSEFTVLEPGAYVNW